jgi:stress response protein SCP2
VRILGSHDKNELKLIADHYLEAYGQTLVEALKSELSGCFRKAAIAWVGVPDPLNLSALKTALAAAAATTTTATAPPVLPSRSLPERPTDTSSALNSTYTHNLQAGESTSTGAMDRLKMGLGWDVARGQAIDLDAGVIMLDSSANVLNTVYFASKEAPGVRCGEDNRSGDQKGDDEMIDIQLSAIPQHITTLVFTVHCYTAGASFASVNSAYARIIIPATGHVCALFKLDGNIRSQGVAFAM